MPISLAKSLRILMFLTLAVLERYLLYKLGCPTSKIFPRFIMSKTPRTLRLLGLALSKFRTHHKHYRKTYLILPVVMLISTEPGFVIDGVTAATATAAPAHPKPKLHLTASPAIVNNTIRSRDEQTITIDISASDVNGPSSLLIGMVQNGYIYSDQSYLLLPDGASFTVDSSDPTKATFSWTPALGTSSTSPRMSFKFGAFDTKWNISKTQTVNINIDDNLAPTFDEASMPASQPVKVDSPLNIPITANPDPDKDNVNISADSLPKGAKLTKAKQNANGQWVSYLKWKPILDQIGTHTITFFATDDKINAAQTSYPMDFVVDYVDAPQFDASMQNVVTATIKKPLKFKVIVNADPYSKQVSISNATLLPPGAKLSKTRKVKGQWVATMIWKPSAAEAGNSYPVTFAVDDPAAGSGSTAATDVTFDVTTN
jgi:hypothetical protein